MPKPVYDADAAAVVREVILAQALCDYWKTMRRDGSRVADEEIARAKRRIATGMRLLAEAEHGA